MRHITTKADELKNIFTQIEDEIISSAQSPTQVDQGEDPSDAGFITLTDQLGDYMQVDDINTLVYANKLYKNPDKTETTKDGKTVVTYTLIRRFRIPTMYIRKAIWKILRLR